MVDFFLQFHSGWRFLVILTTVLVGLFFLAALLTRKTQAKHEILALKIWGGMIDMQVTLGIILLIAQLLDGREIPRQVMEHLTMGFIALIFAHIPAFYKRLNGEPSQQTRRIMGLVLPIVVMLVVAFGILTIREGIFAMTEV